MNLKHQLRKFWWAMETGDQYVQDRLAKAKEMRKLGVDPYGQSLPELERELWEPACNLASSCMKMDGTNAVPNMDLTPETGPTGVGYGRIVLRRAQGGLHFLTVRDHTGDIQIALNKKRLSEEAWAIAQLLDLGDIIQFVGVCAPTRKGEPTVWPISFTIAAKSTMPPPAKHEGLVDVELRYRKRYVDLWSNPEVMKVMKARSEIVRTLRNLLDERGYYEVETPILQTIPGGAAAKPFVTQHNALGIPLYMRIAPELYLKRLLVGGFERVFEIGRNFRNEGMDRTHNPEFTSLEAYEAFSDHEQMADLVEYLICGAGVDNGLNYTSRPWRRVKMVDLVKEEVARGHAEGVSLQHLIDGQQEPMTFRDDVTPEQWHAYYEKHVEQTIKEPTFVTHLPASAVPLAKDDGHGYALAFELIADGKELGCGYTELNDPAVQLERLKQQLGTGDEAQKIDYDFLEALAVGMPPAGGIGIGIDRLVMYLTGAESVRDVLLFPTMKVSTDVKP